MTITESTMESIKNKTETRDDIESNNRVSVLESEDIDIKNINKGTKGDKNVTSTQEVYDESGHQANDIRACKIAMKNYANQNSYALCENLTDYDIEIFIQSELSLRN